ncbi:MAG: Na/Pi cotransporter family protein [Bacteroidia bacterium]
MEFWGLIAGLGLFLYGMNMLESVLRNTTGRSMKLFLKNNTGSVFKSIMGGTIVTGIVQSSSVVSLIVLAFVESGVITFRNALAVILGTNLGTTVTSWIVTLFGFKFNILSYSLPVIAVSSLVMFFFERRKNLYNLFAVFFALGILFFGLGFMKDNALVLVQDFDLKAYSDNNNFTFLLIGFVLTTIIQSSSATVALTLTALYTQTLTFPAAMSLVIGSEVGTTIKVLLWGMKGTADKKRVAVGNFLFNIITSLIVFVFIEQVITFIQVFLNISDPMIGLVFFQSATNIFSILLFVPILQSFANWLERNISGNIENGIPLIDIEQPDYPVLATEKMKSETYRLFEKALRFNRNVLCRHNYDSEGFIENLKSLTATEHSINDDYRKLKQKEGDLLKYFANIQQNRLQLEDSEMILQFTNAARLIITSAKAIKDISHNIREFEASANDLIHNQCKLYCEQWMAFEDHLKQLRAMDKKELSVELIDEFIYQATEREKLQKQNLFAEFSNNHLEEIEVSTLLNVSREVLSAQKSLLNAYANLELHMLNNNH